jgi:biotin carboxyl carrier protein
LQVTSTAGRRRPGKRAYLWITMFAVGLVIMPFLFWYNTWFGRKLTNAEVDRYLSESAKPRRAQHALVQVGERMSRGDTGVRRFYPKVIAVSSSPLVELRQTAAWIMGQDHTYDPFHEALRKLLSDRQPMVRRNAALALTNFRDPAALPELRAMLRPYTVASPASGYVKYRLKAGEYVNPGTLIARIGAGEVRSPLPGEVRALSRPDASGVYAGEPLAEIAADKDHVWEALRALLAVGEMRDVEDVRRYTRGVPGMPDRVQKQAAITLQAIQSRAQ